MIPKRRYVLAGTGRRARMYLESEGSHGGGDALLLADLGLGVDVSRR